MAHFSFLLPQFAIGGGTLVVAQYARELRALGHQVTVCAPRQRAAKLRDVLRGRSRFHLGTDGAKDHFADMLDALRVLPAAVPVRARDLPDADFLISTWWETTEWALDMPAAKGRHVHLVQGYEAFPYVDLDRLDAVYRAPVPKIAVSGWIAQQLRDKHDTEVDAVIANAVDSAKFAFQPEPGTGDLRLGFVYSNMAIKNSEMVIALKHCLDQAGLECTWRGFGVYDLPSPFSAVAIDYQSKPPQDQIPQIYQSCDLWLFPTLEEGFGLPILEALSSGTPVVSSRAGAGPDLIAHRQNGYLCDATPQAFAQAILEFSRLDAAQKAQMRLAARDTALAHSWPKATQRLLHALGVA